MVAARSRPRSPCWCCRRSWRCSGTRINSLAPKSWRRRSEHADEEVTSGFWYRLSHAVMRRPALIATVTSAALIIVALPALGIHFNTVDARVLPTSEAPRQVADILDERLPAGPQRADLPRHRRPERAARRRRSSPPTPPTLGALPARQRRHASAAGGPGHLAHRRHLRRDRALADAEPGRW